MYSDNRLQQINEDTFTFAIRKDEDFRILQLTDLHLGFGWLSRSKDTLAMDAVRQLIERSKPDMLVLTGVGHFLIELMDDAGEVLLPLVLLDSNMYGEDGWFFSGFDRIRDDQVEWCMQRLDALKEQNPALKAMAFFHMPPREFKEAYEKMKLGDHSVIYQHGSIAEKDEYFGISKYEGTFFARAVDQDMIKWMFCGHDHLNTLSLTYQGIQMTYGMSIDYLGYKDIAKSTIQRGGTLITRKADGSVEIGMVPLGSVVSTRVRGVQTDSGDK